MNEEVNDNLLLVCANCGKGEESSVDLKSCTACKMVKYCNRQCQIAHRPQHKKACKKRAKALHNEALVKEPPPQEECHICMLRLPVDDQVTFMRAVGKIFVMAVFMQCLRAKTVIVFVHSVEPQMPAPTKRKWNEQRS